MSLMKAVVMAGGEGSRLRPITANVPKPLTPVCNRPLMEHILLLLKRNGINDVVATLHYLADEVQSMFGDGSDYDLNLSYSIEDTPLGTAGSVKKAESLLKDGTFFIVSGDALTDCDLTKALQFHKEKGSVATLILARVQSPLDFGVVITDEEGRIKRFLEKPSWSEVFSDTVNTGMYILEPEIFDLMQSETPYDWSSDIFPRLLEANKPLYGYVMDEYWCDVGTLNQYREAQEHLLAGRVGLDIPGERQSSGIWVGAGSVIDPSAKIIPPVCIGRNVKIRRNAKVGPYAVIGDNGFIEEDSRIERSVLWDNSYIGPNVHVSSAIVCSRTTVKRGTVIQEEAVVGDRCLIDVDVTVRPRVKLWPDKMIERGSTVTMSLVWGNKWRGNLFRELGVAGLSNIEITPDFACRLASSFGSCLPKRSRIVASRDSTRSSRMIKRAFISSLVSVGCDILDLRSCAAPVARHFVKQSGAQGAVHVRKLPGNSRVTLIELFDQKGSYLSSSLERKVETTFFREDFARTDPDDLGVIDVGRGAVEGYSAEYLERLGANWNRKRLRVVCDYGYSAYANFMPEILAKLGVDSLSLNSYAEAKLAPRTKQEIEFHVSNLRNIVGSLGYDMGILLTDEGERLTMVDDRGEVLSGNRLFAALCLLVAKTDHNPSIAMSVTAPSRLEELLKEHRCTVIRSKADARSLMKTSMDSGVTFAGDERGGFIFQEFHPGFDAAFTFGKLATMLRLTGLKLSEIAAELPPFQLAYEQVRCPWEAKGAVMRRISEESSKGQVDLLDGIKIYDKDQWVLVLPDAVEPLFHVYAESPEAKSSEALVGHYVKKIEAIQVE